MINKIIKYAKYLLVKTNNLVKRRIILSFYKKYAGLLEDLKSMKQFEKYFITKEDAEKHLNELKSKNEPIRPEDGDWYEPTLEMEEFYVYQDQPLGVTNILYGKCFVVEFVRRGYDDIVCLAGVYPIDEEGNVSGKLMGYRIFNKNLFAARDEIMDTGIKGLGRLYITGDQIYKDLDSLKEYVQEFLISRDKQIK